VIVRAALRSTYRWTDREAHAEGHVARASLEARIPEGFELAHVRSIDRKGGQPVTVEAEAHSRVTRELTIGAPSYGEVKAKLAEQVPDGWEILYSIAVDLSTARPNVGSALDDARM